MDDYLVESYLRKAEECEQMAERAADPGIQEAYRDLARQWEALAGKLERANTNQSN
jgi:hypothetical protein